jgi:hypothetical protein
MAKRGSPIDLCVEDIDVVAEPAKHNGERAVLRTYAAVEEGTLKLAGDNANPFSLLSCGNLGAVQLMP